MSLQGKTLGYIQITGPDGVMEHETFTCCHCSVIETSPRPGEPEKVVSICPKCMAPTCVACTKKGGCDPFEKKIERMEARGKILKSMGLAE